MIRSFCIGLLLAMVLLAGNLRQANATHLMGGELTYQFEEAISGGAFYSVKLIVYRYCDTVLANPAPLDDQMFLGIYINDTLDPTGPKVWYATEILSLTSSEYVTSIQGGVNCNFETSACIQKGEYNVTILIPDNPDGFHLAVERCCRNGNILNLSQPGAAGMTFYAFIPGNMPERKYAKNPRSRRLIHSRISDMLLPLVRCVTAEIAARSFETLFCRGQRLVFVGSSRCIRRWKPRKSKPAFDVVWATRVLDGCSVRPACADHHCT